MGERTIQEGDMVVLGFGGLKDGYSSDMTRTVHVGEPTREESGVFEVVVRAQQGGFQAVRPGVACQEVDRTGHGIATVAGDGRRRLDNTRHEMRIVS